MGRLAGLDVAEAAAARAGVAEDHERGGAALPAVADVGAGGLLADRVQPLARRSSGAARGSAAPPGRRHLEPLRLALAERAHLAHLEHPGAARVASASAVLTPAPTRAAPRRQQPVERDEPLAQPERLGEAPRHPLAEARQRSARGRSRLSTEVIRTWSIPHGTIHSNGCRSLSTFTANPCVVTPRETCTPIEPILRSPAHTPVRRLAHLGGDALVGQRGDHRPLHRVHVGGHARRTRMIG